MRPAYYERTISTADPRGSSNFKGNRKLLSKEHNTLKYSGSFNRFSTSSIKHEREMTALTNRRYLERKE
jgi:hypothetical protein